MSLKKQTFSGVIWTFADSFFIKGITFVASLILARILGPKEFGLIGMISIFIAIGISLVDSGLAASIIRTKDPDSRDYSTVFYTNLAISIVVYLILFFSAPLIADFYNQQILINLIRVYCLSFVISAFSAIQLAILNKEMLFKKIVIYNLPSTIIGVFVGILLGYLGYGAWSIVWMYLTTQVIMSFLLWIFTKWKPEFIFSKEKLKFHYNFGYKLMLSGLLDKVFKNIYNVVIGKYFSVQTLGYFDRAKAFNDYPSYTLTSVISKVTYPLLSKLQDDKKRIALIYRKLLQFTFFITAPVMLGAAAIAKPLFLLVLGEKWLHAVPFFQILSLAAMLYPIHAFNINVFKVYGRSDLFLKLEIIKKAIVVIALIISINFGIIALVWSVVFTSFISLLINTHYSKDIIKYSTKQQLLDMLPIFIFSGLVFFSIKTIINLLEDGGYNLYLQISTSVLSGIVIYFALNYLFKSKPMMYALQIIKEKKV